MYIIIVGCGRVGSQLATFLSEDGHDVVIIDKQKNSFRRLGSSFNGLAMEGLGFDQEVLKKAGIERADAFAAVTDLDNTNMMAVEVATKLFNVPKAVARLYNPTRELTYQKMGIEYVCGTKMLAEKMLQTIVAPQVDIIATLQNLYIVKVIAGEHLEGKMVSEVDRERDYRIITIIRKLKNIFCQPKTVVKKGDELIIIARKRSLPNIQLLARKAA